jgi:hypothetical protein
MSNDSLRYQNTLMGVQRGCRIAEAHTGACYLDEETGSPVLLWSNPVSDRLSGLTADQAKECRLKLKAELTDLLQTNRDTGLTGVADTVSSAISQRGPSLSLEAEACLDLPSDARAGRNKVRLRDHALLTSGIASALPTSAVLLPPTITEKTYWRSPGSRPSCTFWPNANSR